MTATSTARMTKFGPAIPAMGTLPIAANVLIVKNTLVGMDGSGRAVPTTDGDGFDVIGVANATYNNVGGAAAAMNVELKYGIAEFAYTGSAPVPGVVMYGVDNQTVSTSSDTGQRGIAGVCTEVKRTGHAYILVSPLVRGIFGDGAAVASDVTQLLLDVAALQDNALTAQAVISVPVSSFRIYSTGGALVPFNDGVADGIDPTAESLGYKFNVASTTAIAACVPMPMDLDDAEDVVIHVLGFRVGASDVTAALDVTAFFRVAGAAFSADADAGGDTDAFAAATTVLSEVTRTIAAADVPASPSSLLITLVPTAALDADDLVVTDVWIEYTRKLLTA